MVRDEGPNLPAMHPQRAMGLLPVSDLWELSRAIRDLSWGPHATVCGVRLLRFIRIRVVPRPWQCLSTPELLDCQPLVALTRNPRMLYLDSLVTGHGANLLRRTSSSNLLR